MLLSALALSLLTVPALAIAPQEKAITDGLAQVQKLVERRQWDRAYDTLRALLVEHEGDESLLREADSLRVDMQRIVFWRTHQEPDPATLVSGDLKKYKDGKIEIVYAGEGWDDWEPLGEKMFSWPARFDGPYTITIAMKNYPASRPLAIVLAASEDPVIRVSFGLKDPLPERGEPANQFYPAAMDLIDAEGKETELDSNETNLPTAVRPAEVKVQVSASKITAYLDGKKYLDAKRPKGEYGNLALFLFKRKDESAGTTLTISGEIQPSWLQNKADAAMESARTAFDASYVEQDHLPAWLLAGPAPATPVADAPPQRIYPGPELTGELRDAYRVAIDHLKYLGDEEGVTAQLEHVDELAAEGELSEALLAFLRMRVHEDAGNFEAALPWADAVIAADPEHLATHVRRARVLSQLGKDKEADDAWTGIVVAFPGSIEAIEACLFHLIERNDISRASAVARSAAFASKESAARLDWLRKILLMADKGPAFERSFEFVSEHYLVRSDISREICSETARLLESAYTSYSVHLRRTSDAVKTKFRVYLFSGEASYQRYADEAFGGRMESTAGVYSGLVKQLLIWNLPDADERRRTVIHEGFHQYFDAVTVETPRWFNEGVAQYYELADTVNGKFTTGQLNANDVRLLGKTGILPLAEFFQLDSAAFMDEETVSRNYAQAWAFVHFLQHSGKPQAAIYAALFDGLCQGLSADGAMRVAFSGVELDQLEAAFVEHLDTLSEG